MHQLFVLLQYRSGGNELPPGTWDFAFTGPRSFILTSASNPGSLEIFALDSSLRDGEPRRVASLGLPDLQPGQEIHNFTTHTAPFLANPVSADAPFAPSQDDRLHAMTLQYGDRGPRVLLLVKNSFFMSLIPPDDILAKANVERAVLPWAQWGPQNTRFLEFSIRSSWLRYAHSLTSLQILSCPEVSMSLR